MRIGFFGVIAILGATLSAPAQENRCIDHTWLSGQCDSPAAGIWSEPSDEPYGEGWCCGRQGWIVDAGVYVLAPRWNNNPAYAVNTYAFNGSTVTDQTLVSDFPTQSPVAPFVSLAYVGQQGLGIRGRWWRLDGSSGVTATNPAEFDPALTNTLYSANPLGLGFSGISADNVVQTGTFDSHLLMNVADVEAVWEVGSGRGSLLLAAGLRYAEVAQRYDVAWLQTALDPLANNVSGQLLSGHRFRGVGPTLAIEGRYPLGTTHLALFASTRGSVLFGTRRDSATQDTAITDYYGTPVELDHQERFAQSNSPLPVSEVELGAAYGRMLGRYRLNCEAAFVGQAWWNAGNAANTQVNPGNYIDTTSDTALGLIGFRVTAGLSY